MNIQLNIPDYLTIKDWKFFSSLEHLTNIDKMIVFISYIAKLDEDEVRQWTPSSLTEVYSKILENLNTFDPAFYPVIEIDGVLHGFSSISKMTLGEYVDLEHLTKEPIKNLEEIMAIFYRPIAKHTFGGIEWAIKSQYKIAIGKTENLFRYYELEKYDTSVRLANAEKLSNIPAAFALGALGFFLNLANISLLSTNHSSHQSPKEREKMITKIAQTISMPTGDGSKLFSTYRKVPSFKSVETTV